MPRSKSRKRQKKHHATTSVNPLATNVPLRPQQHTNGHSNDQNQDTSAMTPTAEQAQSLLSDQFAANGNNSAYQRQRDALLTDEASRRWDEPAKSRASQTELDAQAIVFKIRESERVNPDIYGNVPGEAVPGAQTRDMGGRFLVNKPSIEKSTLFNIAQHVPKGAHLHIHFNSELPPAVLLPHAKTPEMAKTMFVRTSRPLLTDADYDAAEIIFNVLPETTLKADCYSPMYNSDIKDQNNSPWMLWSDFRIRFPNHIMPISAENEKAGLDNAECWAQDKMVITIDQGYGDRQTTNGAWACFNQGTRAFKGLLNYEGVYRQYIGQAIDHMIEDKIMYAELRPMLLDKTIPTNDGLGQLSHSDQMKIICTEVKKKQNQLEAEGRLDEFPFGLKIIYSTPRSIPREKMQAELQDCLKLKLEFPDLICGFDLVGAEDRPNHIGFYADLLVAFTNTCKELGISIPFMFHAGETLLDTGGSSKPDNSNLYDSLLLNCKRIGHGYALLKHPLLMEKYKEANICLELCPISNELLHLSGNVREHPYSALLAAGLHCSLNADNPSLFSSSLSHEFYQVMVGDPRMTIHGWKQLAEWSIEHSCLTPAEIETGLKIFRREWENYCEWIVREYKKEAEELPELW